MYIKARYTQMSSLHKAILMISSNEKHKSNRILTWKLKGLGMRDYSNYPPYWIGYTNLTYSNLLLGQEWHVCICGGALILKQVIEDYSTFAEIGQRDEAKGNLKEDVGKNS